MPKSAPAKSRKPQVTLVSAPPGFGHRWDKLTDEFKAFVVKAEAHGKKFVAGKATTKEQLEFLLSTPPKLRATLMNTPALEIGEFASEFQAAAIPRDGATAP